MRPVDTVRIRRENMAAFRCCHLAKISQAVSATCEGSGDVGSGHVGYSRRKIAIRVCLKIEGTAKIYGCVAIRFWGYPIFREIHRSREMVYSQQLSPSSQAPRQVKAGQNVRAMGNGGAGPARRSN